MKALRGLLAANLPADSFAVVMATGIVSIAARDDGHPVISDVLGVLAGAAFAVLVVSMATRLLRDRRILPAGAYEPTPVFGLYTFVAGCGVLGARLDRRAGGLVMGLGAVAFVAWLLLVPKVWTALRSQPLERLRRHARGSWLLAAVGTQTIGVIAADVARGPLIRPLLTVTLIWWALGVLAYVGITALIVWRALDDPIRPEAVTPDSWILMGALAIATLGGGELLVAAHRPGAFGWLHAVMTPATLTVWAVGSAWIPPLVAAEVWRVRRVPGALRYVHTRWATVFPIGMYTTATYIFAAGLGQAHALDTLSHTVFWVALATWCAAAYGLARLAWRVVRARRT